MSKKLYDYIINKEHHKYRKEYQEFNELAAKFHAEDLCPKERMTRRLELLTGFEEPVFLPEEKICFLR